jgi:hypothetical protein
VGNGELDFNENHGLLTWAHKLPKNGKSLISLLHFAFVLTLNHSPCSHFAIILDSRKYRTDNIFMTKDGNYS